MTDALSQHSWTLGTISVNEDMHTYLVKVEEEEHAKWCMSSLEVGAEVDVQDNTYQLSSDSYTIWACGDVDENAN